VNPSEWIPPPVELMAILLATLDASNPASQFHPFFLPPSFLAPFSIGFPGIHVVASFCQLEVPPIAVGNLICAFRAKAAVLAISPLCFVAAKPNPFLEIFKILWNPK
jgi:hypothetical protein